MNDVVSTLRAIVRDELARLRLPDLAVVTEVFARESEGGDGNHQVNLRLRSSGVELQRVPVVTGRLGLCMLPRVDDLLVVSFLNGDLNAPVALGAVYDEALRPPVGAPHEVVYQPPDDEESGVRRLHVELANGTMLTVEDEEVRIESGGTTVVVHHDGDVELSAAGKVTISSSADIDLSADGNISIAATGDLKLSATGAAELAGTAGTTVKSPQIKLAGMTDFSPS